MRPKIELGSGASLRFRAHFDQCAIPRFIPVRHAIRHAKSRLHRNAIPSLEGMARRARRIVSKPIDPTRHPMRNPLTHALAFALTALLTLAASRDSRADDAFDVKVAGGKVVVTTKGPWHINKKYPWKLTVGDQKISVKEFALDDKSASVKAPKGKGQLRGGICNKDQCRVIKHSIEIP